MGKIWSYLYEEYVYGALINNITLSSVVLPCIITPIESHEWNLPKDVFKNACMLVVTL